MTYYKKNGKVYTMNKTSNIIITKKTNGISRIKINKPNTYNALSQKNIEAVQNELSDLIVDADSGGGMIQVKANGKQEILEINIDPEALVEEKEMLEDLIISAVNKALSKAQEESQEKMNAAAGGMVSGIKIPGM